MPSVATLLAGAVAMTRPHSVFVVTWYISLTTVTLALVHSPPSRMLPLPAFDCS